MASPSHPTPAYRYNAALDGLQEQGLDIGSLPRRIENDKVWTPTAAPRSKLWVPGAK